MSAIKQLLVNYKLKKVAFVKHGTSKPWVEIKSIGILYNGRNSEIASEVAVFLQHLKLEQKKVHQFIFWPSLSKHEEVPASTMDIDYLNSKQLNWEGLPKSIKNQSFTHHNFDLLFDFNIEDLLPLKAVSMHSSALLKIGKKAVSQPQLHMQIELADSSPAEQIRTIAQCSLQLLKTFR